LKANKQVTHPLLLFRFVAVAILFGTIIVFAWKGGVEKNQISAMQSVQSASSLAFASQISIQKVRASEAGATQSSPLVTTKLKGHFSLDNENSLIKQLMRDGYIYFFSYRQNEDGSAVIAAMRGQLAIQPVETITVDRNGNATASTNRFR
jgi:hypothetical protein